MSQHWTSEQKLQQTHNLQNLQKKKQTHPTVIHIHFKKKVDKAVNPSDVQCSEPEPTVNNTLVSRKAVGGQTGAGSNGILPIFPVQVKAKKKKSIKWLRPMDF